MRDCPPETKTTTPPIIKAAATKHGINDHVFNARFYVLRVYRGRFSSTENDSKEVVRRLVLSYIMVIIMFDHLCALQQKQATVDY